MTDQVEAMFVRIKPYDARKGYLRKRHMIEGVRFDVDRGWYKITDLAFAERLMDEKQIDTDPESKDLFDVCTEEEAKKIDARERGRSGRAFAEDATAPLPREQAPRRRTDMTTEDVKRRRKEEPGWKEDMADPKSKPMIDPDPDGTDLDSDSEETGSKASPVGKIGDEKPTRRRSKS